ncbi:MAG: cyclic nucleotide-binding domain-containing protein [Candidatus Dadabacteria bacterium]|nr:MAG: cyclic nucleotide-binding domain-containing protein [Candidatus Dadabacteria bacterium]
MSVKESTYEPGTVIFREGEEGQDLYVLLSGTVRVSRSGWEVAEISEPGAYFGEMSSLLGEPRSATVTAVTEVRALVVPAASLEDFFGRTPQLALRMARDLAKRLAETTERLVEG